MMKKSALVLPVLAALALTGGNGDADAFDVVVSASVSTSCSLSNVAATLTIAGGITNANGQLDQSKDLSPTDVATVNCNGPAKVQLTADAGYFKNAASCSGESAACILYNAKLAIGSLSTSVVNASNKTSTFNTPGSISNAALKLNMDLSGMAAEPLVAGTYSEKFTVTVSPL